jgi:hypothetical protein
MTYPDPMGTRPDNAVKMRALRQRQGLLDAFLDAVTRLDGPSRRAAPVRKTGTQRGSLSQPNKRTHLGRNLSRARRALT